MSQPDKFAIRQVNVPDEERRDEQLGSKSKFWFTWDDGRDWLFKRGRDNEDWSEKVAEVLADLLGLPHAQVELATNLSDGAAGIVSRSLLQREKGDLLVHGNEILFRLDESYPLMECYHTSEHTAEAVEEALERFNVMP